MRATWRMPALVAIVAAAITGCGGNDPTAPEPANNGIPGDFYRLMQTSYVDGALLFSDLGDNSGQLVTMDVDGTPVVAGLIRVGDRYVDGGTMRVGQSPPIPSAIDTLARLSVPVYGQPWYLYTSVPNLPALPPIAFDGVAFHHFKLSGSPQCAAFEDSVLSVSRAVISEPASGAIVPRNSDLVVSWSNAGADPNVRILCFVVSSVNSDIAPGLSAPDPDGTSGIEHEALEVLPAGSARLTVVRYRVVDRMNGPIGLHLKCEAIARVPLTLQ